MRHIEIDPGDSAPALSARRDAPGVCVWYQRSGAGEKRAGRAAVAESAARCRSSGSSRRFLRLQWHLELTVNTANIVENYATFNAQRVPYAAGGDKVLQHCRATLTTYNSRMPTR